MRSDRPIIRFAVLCAIVGLFGNLGCGLFLVFFPETPAALSASVSAQRYQLFRSPGLANETTVHVVPAGGLAPYSYTWSATGPDGRLDNARLDAKHQSLVTFSVGELDGPYRLVCVVTDANQQQYHASVVIQVGGDIGLDITTERLGVVAGGGPAGQTTIHLNPQFGTPPFTATWVCTAPDGKTDNGRLDTTDPLSPTFTSSEQVGTYILTATILDAAGATTTQSVIVVVGQTLGVDVVVERPTVLPGGGSNGLARLLATAIGGTEPYEYEWEIVGPSGNDRTALLWDSTVRSPFFESDAETGTFWVRCAVTDAAGTVLIGSTTIVVGESIGLNITADRLTLPVGPDSGHRASLAADVRGGREPVSLQWTVIGPGDGDFSYLLSSPGSATTSFDSPDQPGAYLVRCTATDHDGNTAVDSLTLTVGDTLGVVVSTGNESPAVGGVSPMGTAQLIARAYGGLSPYSYLWTATDSSGQDASARLDDIYSSSPTFTGSTEAGRYSIVCTVTDAAGATAADAIVLSVGQPLNVDVTVDRQTLLTGGELSGRAQLIPTVIGGITPYTYQWSVIGPNQVADPGRLSDTSIVNPVFTSASLTGTYRLTLTTTDAMGTVFVDSVEVVISDGTNAGISAIIAVDRQRVASGGESITARILPTGGIAPLTYEWAVTDPSGNAADDLLDQTTGSTVTFTSDSTQGAYRLLCTVRDAEDNTCTDSVQITVSDAFLLNCSASQTHVAPGGTIEVLADRSGGTAPFTYAWKCVSTTGVLTGSFESGSTGSGTALSASTDDFTNTWTSPSGVDAMGTYRITVTATDAHGDSFTDTVMVTVNDSLLADLTATKVYLRPGQSAELSIQLTGGSPGFTHAWTSRNASGALAGAFTTDSTGTGAALQITAGAATNTWTAPPAAPGVLGTYRINVAVTDANGTDCADTVSIIVNDPFSLDVAASSTSIAAGATTTLDADRTGGEAPFTFTWTAQNSSGTYAGSFNLGATGTGKAGQSNCDDDTSIVWTAPAAASGIAGSYLLTCVATDALGRTFTDSTTVHVGDTAPIAVHLTSSHAFVSPGGTVNLSAAPADGVADFDYTWSAVNSSGAAAGTLGSASQTGLAGNATNTWTAPAAGSGTLGTYRIQTTLVDALGHQATDTVHVVVASPMSVDLRAVDPVVTPSAAVTLKATPTGGEAPFSVAWQAIDASSANVGMFTVGAGAAGTATQSSVSGTATNTWSTSTEGRYTIQCTFTDNTGQVFTDSVEAVVQPQHILLLDVRADRTTAAPGEVVTLTADRTGGVSGFSYAWSVVNESGNSAGSLGSVTQSGLADDATNTWTAPTGSGVDGTYRVICTLTDSGGRTFVDSTSIDVSSLAIQNLFLAPAVNPQLLAETNLSNTAKTADPGLQLTSANGLVSPDHPRNVVITIYDQNTSINGGLARVTGLDARGFAQSEVITIATSTQTYNTYYGVKPFATVTSVDLFSFTGTINTMGQVDTISIAAGDKFGLTGLIRSATDVAYVYEGTSVKTSGYTVDATTGQQGITFASAPNGTRNYTVVFRAR